MTRAEHRHRAAVCGMQAVQAYRTALVKVVMVTDDWDYYVEQAVRMTRLAAWHAFKSKPSIKPPDAYDRMVARS